MNENGYIFTVSNDIEEGYIVVSYSGSKVKVIEASNKSNFIYQDKLEDGEIINAIAPLSYAMAETSSNSTNGSSMYQTRTSEVEWRDLYSGELIDIDLIEQEDYYNDGIMTVSNSELLADSTYVDSYDMIYGMRQPSGTTCTPTSAAILLRYYNMAKSGYGGVTKSKSDEELREALISLMGGTVSIEKYMSSMDKWFEDTTYSVSTYAWTTSYDYKNTTNPNIKFLSGTKKLENFSTYKGLINVSSPVILMLGKNMLSYLTTTQLHAVVGYGYSNYDGGYYAIIADPNDKTIDKIVSWDALHENGGTFGLYAMFRTTIKK